MARKRPEWIAKHPDQAVPPRVRLRIWRKHDGRCHLTGRKITASDAWDLDHIVALVNGGEHRESNLAPAIRDKHRQKTAEDVKLKARGDRAEMRRAGIRTSKRKIASPVRAKAGPQRTATSPRKGKFPGDIMAWRPM